MRKRRAEGIECGIRNVEGGIGNWKAEDRKLIVKKIFNQRKTRLGSSRVFLFSGFPPLPSLGQALRGNDIKTINIK
jgi:hypothetical protein